MAVGYNPRVVTDGLVFIVDPANNKSYVGVGSTSFTLINNGEFRHVNGVGFTSDNGGAFDFDQTDDYQICDTGDILDKMDTEFGTVSVWHKPENLTGVSSGQEVFDRRTGSKIRIMAVRVGYSTVSNTLINYVHSIRTTSNTVYSATIYGVGVGSTTISGEWVNSTITYDGSTVSGYLNSGIGSLSNGVSKTATNTSPSGGLKQGGSGKQITLGRKANLSAPNSNSFAGKVGIVLYYDRALTAAEVAQNYNALKGRYV